MNNTMVLGTITMICLGIACFALAAAFLYMIYSIQKTKIRQFEIMNHMDRLIINLTRLTESNDSIAKLTAAYIAEELKKSQANDSTH